MFTQSCSCSLSRTCPRPRAAELSSCPPPALPGSHLLVQDTAHPNVEWVVPRRVVTADADGARAEPIIQSFTAGSWCFLVPTKRPLPTASSS